MRGWGGEAGTAARQFVRLPFKLWHERAFSHKWHVPAQVLRVRYQGAEGGCEVSHTWSTPGPYCSESPLPRSMLRRGVFRWLTRSRGWEPAAAELNRPSRLVFQKRWTREGGQREEVRYETELSDTALSERRLRNGLGCPHCPARGQSFTWFTLNLIMTQ